MQHDCFGLLLDSTGMKTRVVSSNVTVGCLVNSRREFRWLWLLSISNVFFKLITSLLSSSFSASIHLIFCVLASNCALKTPTSCWSNRFCCRTPASDCRRGLFTADDGFLCNSSRYNCFILVFSSFKMPIVSFSWRSSSVSSYRILALLLFALNTLPMRNFGSYVRLLVESHPWPLIAPNCKHK